MCIWCINNLTWSLHILMWIYIICSLQNFNPLSITIVLLASACSWRMNEKSNNVSLFYHSFIVCGKIKPNIFNSVNHEKTWALHSMQVAVRARVAPLHAGRREDKGRSTPCRSPWGLGSLHSMQVAVKIRVAYRLNFSFSCNMDAYCSNIARSTAEVSFITYVTNAM